MATRVYDTLIVGAGFTGIGTAIKLDEHGFSPVHYDISERYRCCMEVIAEKR